MKKIILIKIYHIKIVYDYESYKKFEVLDRKRHPTKVAFFLVTINIFF